MSIKKFAVVSIMVILVFSSGCGAGAATEPPSTPETPPTEPTEPPTGAPEFPSCETDPKFNPGKSVALALPGFALEDPNANGVVFQIMPLEEPPAQGFDDPCGVIIGYLFAARDLFLSSSLLPLLPAGEYRIKVSEAAISFINTDEEELATDLVANFREIASREVDPPEAIITYKDICFSWLDVQVCTEPSYQTVLNNNEKNAILGAMETQVKVLAEKGWINPADINIGGTVPDMAGNDAKTSQQASLIAAPNYNFPSQDGDYPIDEALLGVVYAVMNIDVDEYPSLPAGTYSVWANQGEKGWEGRFKAIDGTEYYLPATYLEMRGGIEEPMTIVVDLRLVLCWFRQRC